MRSSTLLSITVLITAVLAQPLFAQEKSVTLYKDINCGCCEAYAEYLEEKGYTVNRVNSDNMYQVKKKFATDQVASCHTVDFGKYVVEGHVPVEAIDMMLANQPDIRGIALPGMPYNSPGMGPEKKGSLNVLQIDKEGNPTGLFTNL